jgi:hypothetical protein
MFGDMPAAMVQVLEAAAVMLWDTEIVVVSLRTDLDALTLCYCLDSGETEGTGRCPACSGDLGVSRGRYMDDATVVHPVHTHVKNLRLSHSTFQSMIFCHLWPASPFFPYTFAPLPV